MRRTSMLHDIIRFRSIKGLQFIGREAKELQAIAEEKGFRHPIWLTERQGVDCGTQLLPGAVGREKFLYGQRYLLFNGAQFADPERICEERYRVAREQILASRGLKPNETSYVPRNLQGVPFSAAVAKAMSERAGQRRFRSRCWVTRRQVESVGAKVLPTASAVAVPCVALSSLPPLRDFGTVDYFNADETTDPSRFDTTLV